MQKDPDTKTPFAELFSEYRILTEWDKVRRNSHDDYGLGFGWFFMGGAYVERVWTVVYVKPNRQHSDEWAVHMCEGNIGACRIIPRADSDPVLVVSDQLMIASHKPTRVVDIPADVQPFVKR